MWSRALTLATASLIGCLVATTSQAQNLDAGKNAAQLFNGSCSACHKSAHGLLKTVSPSALPGFLRQHYTTGTEVAQMLSAYLLSNGAAAPEPRGTGRRGSRADTGSDLRSDAPIGVGVPDSGQGRDQAERPGRKSRRTATSPETESAPVGERTGAKRKLSRKHKRVGSPSAESPASEPGAIDAAVPVPQPVDLPPPSAADIKH
jgi:hypothetical protein